MIVFLVVKRWSSERRMRVMISEFHERKFFDLFVRILSLRDNSSVTRRVYFLALLLFNRSSTYILCRFLCKCICRYV